MTTGCLRLAKTHAPQPRIAGTTGWVIRLIVLENDINNGPLLLMDFGRSLESNICEHSERQDLRSPVATDYKPTLINTT